MSSDAQERCLFSVVTPSMNCAEFIERNIESVQSQGLGDRLEHWVVDGGSTDETVSILKKYPHLKWVSEPDSGLSDAVNKGVQRAQGTWVLWLNADDELADGALNKFCEYQQRTPEAMLFCGDEILIDYDGVSESLLQGKAYDFDDLVSNDVSINQAATLVHRDVYERVGLMDVSYRFAMDYEWTVRAANAFECIYLPFVVARYHMRKGSITDGGSIGQFMEFARVRRKYGLSRCSRADMRIQFYIWTDRLRRSRHIRSSIRRMKRLIGAEVPYTG